MGSTVASRLSRLESIEQTQTAALMGTVVIFDSATGQPLTPVDAHAIVQVWLPDNGRAANGDVAIAHPFR